jgi:predicted nucleotidyltransferase
MKYGLPELTIEKINNVLALYSMIEKAVLYGSRAKGNFKTGSDIDLTLTGRALTNDILLSISSDLDDISIPYTIDLSIYEKLTDADLRDHIERVGIEFYRRSEAISL